MIRWKCFFQVTNCECVSLMNNASAEDSDPRIPDVSFHFENMLLHFYSLSYYAVFFYATGAKLRIFQIQRLLSSGMFYFSSNPAYDLTRSAQHRHNQKGSDIRFFWFVRVESPSVLIKSISQESHFALPVGEIWYRNSAMGIEVHRRVNNCSSFFNLILPDSEAS